jgi:medium-chain acyl-[acyl-carrier-protein] hydrolase
VTRSRVNPWFEVGRNRSAAALRLFCFPYAGGNAQIFHSWCDSVPEEVEVIGVQYPGRGGRFSEPPIARCGEMVEALIPQIEPLLDRPFAFFGHSIGALISFELATHLSERCRRLQRHHFIAARRPPHLGRRHGTLHEMSDESLVKVLGVMGGTRPELLANRDLMAVFLPVLRADFALGETHSYQGSRLLECSATVLCGYRDSGVLARDLHKWRDLIQGHVDFHGYDGGHFFIDTHKREVLSLIARKLREMCSWG